MVSRRDYGHALTCCHLTSIRSFDASTRTYMLCHRRICLTSKFHCTRKWRLELLCSWAMSGTDGIMLPLQLNLFDTPSLRM